MLAHMIDTLRHFNNEAEGFIKKSLGVAVALFLSLSTLTLAGVNRTAAMMDCVWIQESNVQCVKV